MNVFSRLILKYFVRYNNERTYWNWRWQFSSQHTPMIFYKNIRQLMQTLDCHNVLDVGCGMAHGKNILPGYLGLDFSHKIFKKNRCGEFLVADLTKKIPLPNKSFDAVLSIYVLIHIKPEKIEQAVNEICRVASKVIFLVEYPHGFKTEQPHCFSHNLQKMFGCFNGRVIFLDLNDIKKPEHKTSFLHDLECGISNMPDWYDENEH